MHLSPDEMAHTHSQSKRRRRDHKLAQHDPRRAWRAEGASAGKGSKRNRAP